MTISIGTPLLVNVFPSADVARYGLTHVADQCDVDLSRYPAVRDWLDRVANEPGYVPMDWQRQPLEAAQ